MLQLSESICLFVCLCWGITAALLIRLLHEKGAYTASRWLEKQQKCVDRTLQVVRKKVEGLADHIEKLRSMN
mgnify:CR=1 FL=1